MDISKPFLFLMDMFKSGTNDEIGGLVSAVPSLVGGNFWTIVIVFVVYYFLKRSANGAEWNPGNTVRGLLMTGIKLFFTGGFTKENIAKVLKEVNEPES